MTPLSVPQQPEDDPPSPARVNAAEAALTPVIPAQPAAEKARRGRKAEPVSQEAGPCHQAWLVQVRGGISSKGYTLDQLASLTGYSKTRISTLLRGVEYYPSWEITYSVVHVLGLPVWPLRRLWTAGAREAEKNQNWIAERIQAVRPLAPEEPPVAHQAFTETMREPYTAYARALLQSQRAERIVAETFDLLWLGWEHAVASPDVRRYAWCLLRSRVLLRAHRHDDGRPDLRLAAFSTAAQSRIKDPVARFIEISELADFFDTVGALPQDQLDIVVLRYMCGIKVRDLPTVVGLSPARVHTLDHHARGALEQLNARHHQTRE
ncbi:XRE family transcriptional regulator [Streptomyces sp. NPDC060011]|uniref:XRE family transcriptional regulator n=1 Tax=unclassified Streptomyces TaxID=2593676 RepID=UPI0022573CFA|nr:XRE family transcriptional regulator [Streptomyces sp. NBC_00687]MCX4920244.1 XRE family transcriptional regulator [Streptomyces sp. NBC_00687]